MKPQGIKCYSNFEREEYLHLLDLDEMIFGSINEEVYGPIYSER